MAELLEEQTDSTPIVESNVGGGDGKKQKSNDEILAENRVGLYNQILNLKEKGFSDQYKKIGYKKFESLLQDNEGFRTALLQDLNERGFDISPESFAGSYYKPKGVMVADFAAMAQPEPPIEDTALPEDESVLGQVKGLAKSIYNYGKDFYKTVKRDWYTGMAQQGAQVEDFLAGSVDTENLAKYLKKANDVGEIGIEAEYAKDEGTLKDISDFVDMLGPAVAGSFASMLAAGYKKMGAITAAGTVGGAVVGGAPGALVGGTRAAQAAMMQQGYNLEFVSSIIDDLTEQKIIDPSADEKILKKQLDAAFADKELMKPIFEKANTRATIIMGTDALASGIGGRVIGTLGRAAASKTVARTAIGRMIQQSAQKAIQTAPAKALTRMTARAAEVADKFNKTKAGKALDTIGAVDILAGGGGEALAQLKTEGEINWDEVALEGGAEAGFIKSLRALARLGNKKQQLQALPAFNPPKELKGDKKSDTEFVTVTEEELARYRKGDVDPERAAGIVDDVNIALEDPSHLEKLKADDALYAEMVLDAFNKHIVAVENQKLYNVALDDVAELYSKTSDEIREAINPKSQSYNEKIAKDFKNSFNVLQQQYREKAQNDSENAAGVSGEGGIGKKPEQAQSQQGAGQEAAGDGGVFQEAEGQARIAEIDELLADDDAFFAENNDRLLSPEERADLEKERESITGTSTTSPTTSVAPTSVSTGATPAAAPAEVVTGATPAQQPAATEGTPTPEQRAEYGLEPLRPTYRGASMAEWQEVQGGKKFSSKEGFGDNEANVTWVTDNKEYSQQQLEKNDDGVLIEFKPEAIDKSSVESGQQGDETGVRLGRDLDINDVLRVTDKNGNVIYEAATTVETAAPTKGAAKPAKKAKQTAPTTEAAAKPAAKPAAKEIKSSDVEIRKGKTHDKDGVYEAVYKGKVIGKLRFDKQKKVWEDLSGDEFAAKKDAVNKFVLQYNMKAEAAAETTTAKGEKKTTTKKTQTKTQAEEEIPVVEAEVVEEEVTPEGETKEGLGVIPTLVKSDFERNGDLTDAGFEKATRILKSIIDRVAAKAGLPPKRIYEAFDMTSDGKKYISMEKGIREIQVTNFKDVITAVKRIAFDAFPGKEDELNEQINKHVDEFYDAHLEGRDFERNPALNKILRAINDINDIWAGTVAKAESLLEKGKTETKGEAKPTGKTETKPESKKEEKGKWIGKSKEQYVSDRTSEILAASENYQRTVISKDKADQKTAAYLRDEANKKAEQEYDKLFNEALVNKTLPNEYKPNYLLTSSEKVAKDKKKYTESGYPQNHNEKLSKEEHKEEVQNAVDNGLYVKAIKQGILSYNEALKIIESAGVKVAENVESAAKEEKTTETKGEAKPTKTKEETSPITVTEKKTNTSFESMMDFETDGGVLEIGKRPNAIRYSILNLKVDEDKRRQGIATRLLKEALDRTNGQLSGMAGNDGSVEMNYKLGMRAVDSNGNYLTLEETKIARANTAGESILMMLPEDQRGIDYKPFAKQKAETKPTPETAPSKAPSFSEFDAISADRSKMKEAKAAFIEKHGQLAYDAMKEISANFTKITKALQEKEILTKKC